MRILLLLLALGGPDMGGIEVVCVDENATMYGTFQSHNQKVVSNAGGIFMAHVRSRNEEYTAQQWRLSRSTDGGRTFKTIYEATHATNPPALETDAAGNVYLFRPDFADGNAYLYRFLAERDYAEPIITTIPGGAAGKVCAHIDEGRGRLYYFAHNNTFHVLSLDGVLLSSRTLLAPGGNAVLQYPLLSLDADGTLHSAWTTQKHGVYLYWDIHHMLSRDGGETWETMAGEPLELPVVADDTGPADAIVRDDELEAHTWLSSFLALDGRLHFLYLAQTDPPRQHHIRYVVATSRREVDTWPELAGETISLRGLDGFFATDRDAPTSPLYCVMSSGVALGCLVTEDGGVTWLDHSVAPDIGPLYAVGGCRDITADGHIIGSCTVPGPTDEDPHAAKVFFFRIRADDRAE